MFAAPHLPGQSFTSAPHVAHLDYPGSSAMASSYGSSSDPTSHTQQPIMTGTSVLGIKYDGGVMLAADTLASYGSLSRFDDIQRLHAVGRYTCIGASGDMSDFQALQHMLDASSIKQSQLEDGHELRSSQVFEYLGRVMYNRRTKMDPLWNSLVVAGWETDRLAPGKSSGEAEGDADAERPGKPFLAYVDMQGTTYSEPSMATGYGSMIAQPLMRKALQQAPNGVLTEQAAEELLKTCMKVLFYRDARSINKFQIAKITKKGVEISDSQSVETYWGFAEKLRGYA